MYISLSLLSSHHHKIYKYVAFPPFSEAIKMSETATLDGIVTETEQVEVLDNPDIPKKTSSRNNKQISPKALSGKEWGSVIEQNMDRLAKECNIIGSFYFGNNHQLIEELIQDYLVKLVISGADYDDSKASVITYLGRGFEYHCRDYLRRIKANEKALDCIKSEKLQNGEVYFMEPPDEEPCEQERVDMVMKCMSILKKEKYQKVLHLVYWEKLSYEEIGQITGMSLGAVKGTLGTAKKAFKKSYRSMQKS